MSEETVQDSVQDKTISQEGSLNDRESELLREIMQKKERLQKAESRAAELEKKFEEDKQAQLAKNQEWQKLYEDSKTKLDAVMPELESYKARDVAEKDKMLSDFPEEDREVFKEMNYNQLKVVHNKLISKPNNVPNVDSTPASAYQGYASLKEAAQDKAAGKINGSTYEKIKEAFTSKFN